VIRKGEEREKYLWENLQLTINGIFAIFSLSVFLYFVECVAIQVRIRFSCVSTIVKLKFDFG
jgi:hypothetical protein